MNTQWTDERIDLELQRCYGVTALHFDKVEELMRQMRDELAADNAELYNDLMTIIRIVNGNLDNSCNNRLEPLLKKYLA